MNTSTELNPTTYDSQAVKEQFEGELNEQKIMADLLAIIQLAQTATVEDQAALSLTAIAW